jgi:hypothetical protein
MKISNEIKNGLFIFLGISALFLLLKLFGFEKYNFLRFLNIFIIYFGMYRMLKSNQENGITDFGANIFSIAKTAIFGIITSVAALYVYVYLQGGEAYLNTLSENYFFGKSPSVVEYSFGILFEALASLTILIFIVMQYWRPKLATKS